MKAVPQHRLKSIKKLKENELKEKIDKVIFFWDESKDEGYVECVMKEGFDIESFFVGNYTESDIKVYKSLNAIKATINELGLTEVTIKLV